MDDPYYLEPRLIRRSFNAASATFDQFAVLHAEVRKRALERLRLLRATPQSILDLGAATGHGSQALKKLFPRAQVFAVDSATKMLEKTRAQQGWLRRFVPIAGDATALPLRGASIDWVFSNLMLPWTTSIDVVFSEVRRVLKPGGVFCFTSLGPDTLQELRASWADTAHTRVHGFIDMHDIGDALVRARFAEPVLDVDRITLTYPSVRDLLAELRATGSSNRTLARRRSLSGRLSLSAMIDRYETRRHDGKIPATVEVVYGQAWRPLEEKQLIEDGEIRVPINQIRRPRS